MTRLPLYGWLAAEAVSGIGTRLSLLALPWFALTTTGSPTKTGLVALFEVAPMVLLKIVGGPWIDRLGARRVAVACDIASALVVALVPILYAAGWLSLPTLLGLVALAGALRGPGDAAKQTFAPQVATAGGLPMERITGLFSTVERTAGMVGLGIGGILISLLSAPGAIVFDAASFAISAAILAATTTGLARPEAPADAEPYLRQLAEGWAFLRRDRVLLGLMFMVALTNLIDQATWSVLMPVWGRERTSITTVGLLMSAFSGCSAAGAAVAATYASKLPRYWIYLFGFIICGLPRFLALAWDNPLWTVYAVFVVGGFASGFLNPILGAVELERIPAPLIGRVMSLISAACWGLMPLGGVLGGSLVSAFGLTFALLGCGGAYFLITLLPAVGRTWRQIERRQAPAGV